jgi:hypothetical protein
LAAISYTASAIVSFGAWSESRNMTGRTGVHEGVSPAGFRIFDRDLPFRGRAPRISSHLLDWSYARLWSSAMASMIAASGIVAP